jgi:hypothetical protein
MATTVTTAAATLVVVVAAADFVGAVFASVMPERPFLIAILRVLISQISRTALIPAS